MQLRNKRTDSPIATVSSVSSISPVLDSEDVIISINISPVLSLVIGKTTTDVVSSSNPAPQITSSASSSTRAKGVVTTSTSAVSSNASKPSLPATSSISSGSGVGIGAVNVSPGRVANSTPAVTTKTSQVYGAAAIETVTNYGTVMNPLPTRSSGSESTTSTTSQNGPNSSSASHPEINKGRLSREAIIGIVIVFALLWMGFIVLILRKRKTHQRNRVATTTGSSQKHRDVIFAEHRNSLRHFTFGGRSKRLISLGDNEDGALTHPRCTEREGSMRSGKGLPSIIINPSVSNIHKREKQERLSVSSTGSQYIMVEPRQTDNIQPIPDPFSPLLPFTSTDNLIPIQPRLPQITIEPLINRRISVYRRSDRVIPPIPPLPSSPPPLPPIPLLSPFSPSQDSGDPFKDPPSPLLP